MIYLGQIMEKFSLLSSLKELVNFFPDDDKSPGDVLWLVFLGFLVGISSGVVISIFRITSDMALTGALAITGRYGSNMIVLCCWFFLAILAALIVGRLMRNPFIRFGGGVWELDAIKSAQAHAWRGILLPKFIGSWLVMAFGISVGREGPCIQMGASMAMGLKNLDAQNSIERRYFILGGCAAGLAAAFSAPFAGICYVYEIMREKISYGMLVFMLAGSFGVYLSCTLIFGLDVMLPIAPAPVFSLGSCWILAPLGIFCGLAGVAYNYLVRFSIRIYEWQKLVPMRYRPLFPFIGAALMILVFPEVCGEGLGVFPGIEKGGILISYLWLFLIVKLFFTAFCYGSGIPAGLMVPLLCIGGVAGGIYATFLQHLGFLSHEYIQTCLVLGMASSFTAGERAPITAIVLVLEMTGAYILAPAALVCVACAAFTARLAKVGSF